jgi:hypothetical protein
LRTGGFFTWKSLRRWLPGALISLIALYVVFRLARWEDLGPALASIRPIYILAAAGLTLLFLLVRALAWRVILGGKPTLAQTFWVYNQGYLLNNILPFRAGEIGRGVLLGQLTGMGTMQVISSIVIERAFDMAMAAGLLLATLPLALAMEWARPVALITLVVVLTGLLMLFLISRNTEWVRIKVEQIGSRWKFARQTVVPQVLNLIQGLSIMSNPRQFLLGVGLIILSWLVAVTEYYVVLLAIEPDAVYWWGIFTDAVLALGIAIPSAPAALGTFEAAIVGALKILGVDETLGLAYAITLHFVQFTITGVLGLIGLLRQGQHLGAVLADMRLRAEE